MKALKSLSFSLLTGAIPFCSG